MLIVEDEEMVARRLSRLLGVIVGSDLEVLHRASTLESAREHLAAGDVDLLILDLNLNGRDGFDLLAAAAAERFQTIIVSARRDQALRAFEYGVTDFVPKPFGEARLRAALERVTHRGDAARGQLRRLVVKRGPHLVPIEIARLRYIEGAGDYARLHVDDGTAHLHLKTLKSLCLLLPPAWQRIHRSYLVDTGRIVRYRNEPGSRYFAVLDDGSELPASREWMRRVRRNET